MDGVTPTWSCGATPFREAANDSGIGAALVTTPFAHAALKLKAVVRRGPCERVTQRNEALDAIERCNVDELLFQGLGVDADCLGVGVEMGATSIRQRPARC